MIFLGYIQLHKVLLINLRLLLYETLRSYFAFTFFFVLYKAAEYTSIAEKQLRQHFAHYDWQSMFFSFKDVLEALEILKRKNTKSGASKANQGNKYCHNNRGVYHFSNVKKTIICTIVCFNLFLR